MKYSTKYYLLDEEAMQKLNPQQILHTKSNPSSILKDFNTSLVKEKIEKKNLENKQWDELGTKIQPILTSANKQTEEDKSFDPDQVIQSLQHKIIQSKLGLAYSVFSFLSGIDGLKISTKNIFINGKRLDVPTIDVIKDLIYAKNTLSYNYKELIPYIANYKEGDSIILNKEVRRLINQFRSSQTQPEKPEKQTQPESQSSQSSVLSQIGKGKSIPKFKKKKKKR